MVSKAIPAKMSDSWSLKLCSALLAITLLLHPLLYWGELRDSSSLPRYALLGLMASALLAIWGIAFYRKETNYRWHPAMLLMAAVFLWAMLSLNWTQDPLYGLLEAIQLLGLVILCFTVTQFISWGRVRLYFLVSLLSAVMVAFIGLQQNFGFNPFDFTQFAPPSSTFTNKNFVTLYLDLMVFVALVVFLLARKKHQQWLSAMALGVVLSYQFVSHTRGSWLSLLIGVIALLLVVYFNRSIRALVTRHLHGKALMLALVLPFVVVNLPSDVFQPGYEADRSLGEKKNVFTNVRLNIYANTLDLIEDHPLLGTGLGSFRVAFRPYMFSSRPLYPATEDIYLLRTHSDPLQYIAELGLLGGLAMLAFFFWALVLAWRLMTASDSDANRLIGLGLFFSLLLSGVHACVDFPLHKPSSAIQLFVWVGVVIGLSARLDGAITKKAKSTIAILVVLAGLGLTAFNVKYYGDNINASMEMQTALEYGDQGDCLKSAQHIDKSIDYSVFDYRWQQYKAAIYSACDKIDDIAKLAAMNQVLGVDPNNTRALLTRGEIYYRYRQFAKASEDFAVVQTILPHRASGYVGLGILAHSQGEQDRARQYYSKALELQPDSIDVAAKLQMLNRTQELQ